MKKAFFTSLMAYLLFFFSSCGPDAVDDYNKGCSFMNTAYSCPLRPKPSRRSSSTDSTIAPSSRRSSTDSSTLFSGSEDENSGVGTEATAATVPPKFKPASPDTTNGGGANTNTGGATNPAPGAGPAKPAEGGKEETPTAPGAGSASDGITKETSTNPNPEVPKVDADKTPEVPKVAEGTDTSKTTTGETSKAAGVAEAPKVDADKTPEVPKVAEGTDTSKTTTGETSKAAGVAEAPKVDADKTPEVPKVAEGTDTSKTTTGETSKAAGVAEAPKPASPNGEADKKDAVETTPAEGDANAKETPEKPKNE